MNECSFCGVSNSDRELVAGNDAAICARCVCLCLDKLLHNNEIKNAILSSVNMAVTLRTEPVPAGALLLGLEEG